MPSNENKNAALSPEDLSKFGLDDEEELATPPPPAGDGGRDVEPEPAADAKPKPDERSPAERWQENLKTVGIDETQARKILRALIRNGYYERDYTLAGGELKLRFRTRDYQNSARLTRAIDTLQNPHDAEARVRMTHRYNLCGSIVMLNAEKFDQPAANASDEDVDRLYTQRMAKLQSKCGPVIESLVLPTLYKFDGLVLAVLSEGAGEGF